MVHVSTTRHRRDFVYSRHTRRAIVCFAVWYLYKKAYQLQQVNRSENTEQLVGRECTIYFNQGEGKYTVQVSRDGAMREVDVISETSKVYRTGDKAIIAAYREGTLYIN